jgi:hypothetical protein
MTQTMATICGYVVCGFIGLLAGTIIWFIWTNKIDLSHLLDEANGSASLSRFQLLIFTFVIAVSLFFVVEKSPSVTIPDIPQGVLTLLGISASTYAVGKGISYSRDEGVTSPEEREEIRNAAATNPPNPTGPPALNP